MILRERPSVTFEDPYDELLIGRMDGNICDEHECWNEHRCKLIETNKRTFWYKSLQFLLSLHNYDPFAIFKSTSRSNNSGGCHLRCSRTEPEAGDSMDDSSKSCQGYMMDPVKILRLPNTQADHARHKYTRILRFFVSYFFIKTLIMSLTQYAYLKHNLVSRGYNPPWLSMDQVELVAFYLSNPLQVLKENAMLLYTAPSGFCFVGLVLINIYYERYPMNMAILRFILNPNHELKRVDLNIKRKLDDIRMSLGVFARERQQILLDIRTNPTNSYYYKRRFSSPISVSNAKKVLDFEKWRCAQLRSYLDEFDQRLHSFRPNFFSAKYFQDISAKMSNTIVGAHVFYFVCSGIMLTFTQGPPYKNRCAMFSQAIATQNRTITVCNPLDIYTRAELFVLIELTLTLLLSCMISTLNLALFSLVAANQAYLIKSIRNQLVNCCKLIYGDDSCVSRDKKKQRNNAQMNKTEPPNLDKFRLETLVKLMVCETELRDNAHSISELTVHPFYYATGTVVFLVIVGGQFRINETQAIRRFIMIATWFVVNAVAISCAHIFSRVIEFERTMWSILAAQADRVLQYNQSLPSEGQAKVSEGEPAGSGCCTFVSDLWVKFVLATSLNIKSYCARPLYVKLTYEMIIELNFFVVFIYSLSVDLPGRK